MIEQWRNDTPGIEQRIHFNNAGAALPPQVVIDVQQAYLQEEALLGGYEMAAASLGNIQGTYHSLARLLHTSSEHIALSTNATVAYNKALGSIPFEKGDYILTTYNDYVSNHIAFMQLQKMYGTQTEMVPNGSDGCVDVEAMEKAIKKRAPKLVAVTHIPTSSGLIQDVESIGELCAKYDVLYLIDACQSAGQLDLDVNKIKCDFMSATGRKFLRGPRGTGFLYVSQKVLDRGFEPHFLDLHSAEWLAADQYKGVSTAKRFEIWERNYGLVLGLKAAVDYALHVGLDTIRQRVQVLAQHLRISLKDIPGIKVLDPPNHLSGILTCHVEGWNASDFQKMLFEHKINSSIVYKEGARLDLGANNIDWASRLSVHYYNTIEEIDTLKALLSNRL